ncbi:MAG: Inorganic pyrophosphatase, partial [uncultured Acidimicrobiales bacterium]
DRSHHRHRRRDPPWQPEQVRDGPRDRGDPPRPAPVLRHRVPGRLRLRARHPGRGRRPPRRPRPARGRDVPGLLGDGPPRRDAEDGGRRRPGREAAVRAGPRRPLGQRERHLRRAQAAARRDQALLRRLQDARAAQARDDRGLPRRRRGLARDRAEPGEVRAAL